MYNLTEDVYNSVTAKCDPESNCEQVYNHTNDCTTTLQHAYSPSGMDVVGTGPDPYPVHMGSGLKQASLHHQEADVLMVYNAILESSNGQHQSCIR